MLLSKSHRTFKKFGEETRRYNLGGFLSNPGAAIGGTVSHVARSIGGGVSHAVRSVGGEVGNIYAHVVRPALPAIGAVVDTIFPNPTTPYVDAMALGTYAAGARSGFSGITNPTLTDYEGGVVAAATLGATNLAEFGLSAASSALSGPVSTASQLGTTASNYSLPYGLNSFGGNVNVGLGSINSLSIPSSDLLGLSNSGLNSVLTSSADSALNVTNSSLLGTIGNDISTGLGYAKTGLNFASTGLGVVNEFRGLGGQPSINIIGQTAPAGTTSSGLLGFAPSAGQTAQQAASQAASSSAGSSGSEIGAGGGGSYGTNNINDESIAWTAAIGLGIVALAQ